MAEETITDIRSQERENLMAALEAADTPASEIPQESETLASDSQEAEEPETTPTPEAEVTAEKPVADAEGETSEPTEEPVSNREKKSAERLELSWKKTNEAKDALRLEKEEFEASKQSHADDQTSPDDYRELAERYREEGEDQLAALAEQKAQEVEGRKAQRKHQAAVEEVQGQWGENLKDLQEEHPDLTKPESEMSRGVEHILTQRPGLRNYPEGIQDAVEFVKSKIAAKQSEALEKQTVDLKAEIEELKTQTSVTGSPPGRDAAPKGTNELPQDKVREKLLAALQQADEVQEGMRIFR